MATLAIALLILTAVAAGPLALGSHAVAQRASRLVVLAWFGGLAALTTLITIAGAVLLSVLLL